ncbi:MAG: 16S rRNA (cytosine(967)-C(5))-methyltransferase RsmB [Nitrospinota bacterium]
MTQRPRAAPGSGAGRPSSGGADPVRRAAHAALLAFESHPENAEDLVGRFAAAAFDPRDRAFLRELIYGVLRWRNRLDFALGRFLEKPPERLPPAARGALRLGAYQLLFLDRVPAHGAVNASVELAGAGRWERGLVNAVLRKVGQAPLEPPGDAEDGLVMWESHPRWLARRWVASLGPERARARCQANNAEGPLVLRANPLRTTPGELAARLAEEGVTTAPALADPECLRVLSQGPGLTQLPSFAEGLFIVQDEASSLAARYAGAGPGDRALDACAAPGGKTACLAWAVSPGGRVAAADLSPARLRLLRENCARIGAHAPSVVMDASRPAFGESFDLVLVDAPCSGLGVLRRHPDARWRLREEDVPAHGRRQRGLLRAAAGMVRPGGRLVYAVCSNEPEETEEVVASLDRADFAPDREVSLPPAAERFAGRGGALWICPEDAPGLDGFFAMRWRRGG